MSHEENKFKNIIDDLDKNIIKYKSKISEVDSEIIFNDNNQKDFKNNKEKSNYDLISKYQLDNSNLQYENYYLKKQNQFLEEEIKNIKEKYLEMKNDLEEFNSKLDNFDKIKENNLKELNEKYKNSLKALENEKSLLSKNKNIEDKQNNLMKLLNSNKEIISNLGIDINLESKDKEKIFENLFNKLIEENKKLNKKIERLKSVIKQFNIHLEKELDEKNLLNDSFQEKINLTEPTKEKVSQKILHYSLMNKVNYEPPKLDIINHQQFNSFNQLSPNILSNSLRLNNKNQNDFLRSSNPERKLYNDYNSFRNKKRYSVIKKDKFKQKLFGLKNKQLTGLKTKIELLDNMIKEAHFSFNDIYSEPTNFSNSQSKSFFPEN